MSKVALVTGASAGIGYALCIRLMKKGYTVYGVSRRGSVPEGAVGVKADVSDEESVNNAVAHVINKAGRIDLLVNNAGFGISGPVEFTDISEAHDQMNVNFFGEFMCAKAVLPQMRKQRSGTIVFVSSVAGEMAIPYQAFYSASKAAVNSVALALRNEVKDFGIKVSSVMPGDAKTEFTVVRRKETKGDGIYTKNVSAVESMEKDEENGMSPDDVAAVIMKAALSGNPAPFYIAGGKYKFFHYLFKLTPARFIYWLISVLYS